MPRKEARAKAIVRRQEKLGLRLLDRALEMTNGVEVGVDVQLDVFDRMSRWVAVRNRLEDQGETQIDDFKRRIHGTSEAPPLKGRRARVADYQAELDGIKSKLSGRGNRRANSDSGDPGDEVPIIDGG